MWTRRAFWQCCCLSVAAWWGGLTRWAKTHHAVERIPFDAAPSAFFICAPSYRFSKRRILAFYKESAGMRRTDYECLWRMMTRKAQELAIAQEHGGSKGPLANIRVPIPRRWRSGGDLFETAVAQRGSSI